MVFRAAPESGGLNVGAMLLIGGLALLWFAVTGRADALVRAVIDPPGGPPGPNPGDPNALPPATDPGGTELQPPYTHGIPQYPAPPTEDPPSVPGWYSTWQQALLAGNVTGLPSNPGWYQPV